jgi:hypothetical protein
MKKPTNIYAKLGSETGVLVANKQEAYGDSFGKSGEVLRQMFPDGIPPEKFTDALTIVRIVDKLFRVANNPGAFEENPYQDIVGYALLGMNRYNQKKEK